ncbi:retrovirus-related pol polyprotein from transposon TNT 1-94 [Tanacetum coccineum]
MDKVPLCTSYSLEKLIVRPSPLKIENESPMFLERIQSDIYGPIHPPCGLFRYYLVLIDASSRWSHVSLLSTRNVAFVKFLAQIIKLRAHFPDYTVKRVRLDNAGEFTSHAFNYYYMSVGIIVEHSVAHVHTQNGLAFPAIRGSKEKLRKGCHLVKVQKIMHLQEIANQLPDAFTDTKRVTKSHIPAANAPARVEIPNKQVGDNIAQESQKRLKRGRPIGSKDKNPRNKRKVFGPIVTTPRYVKPKTTFGFVIIAVYVDDLNTIGTSKEINEVVMHLKEEFEMKDLGKTKYCLGLQINHMPNGILVHQSNYTEKVLKHFNMDKAKSLSTPMVGRSLNVDNDPFHPCEEDEDVLGLEVPYLSAIGALMYLTNCTRPDISFAFNLSARFSSSPTKRHWN